MNSLIKFVHYWNFNYPVDRWYRRKYNLAFNSPQHRRISVIDVAIDFLEDKEYEKFQQKKAESSDKYVPGEGNFIKKREMSDKELDEMFENWNPVTNNNG